jgi:hypothetical protein
MAGASCLLSLGHIQSRVVLLDLFLLPNRVSHYTPKLYSKNPVGSFLSKSSGRPEQKPRSERNAVSQSLLAHIHFTLLLFTRIETPNTIREGREGHA